MKADAYDLSKVLGFDRQLFAPLFQRPYVWEEEKQWKPFWDDVRKIAEQLIRDESSFKPHFLGAVVLEQFRVPVGKPDARSIIDGQQRLTTIQLLLAALRDICTGQQSLAKLGRSVERLMFNDESVVDEEIDRFKVWPTNLDQRAYRLIMNTESPGNLQQQLKQDDELYSSNIVRAYFYFYESIKQWAAENEDFLQVRLQALINTIRKGLRLVVVDMDDEDNSQLIFETLNARGTPLLPSDLVKNFLFHRSREDELDVNTLYTSYWHPFDYEHRFWRGEIAQGRLKRPRIDLLLQHYLTLYKVDEVSARSLFEEFQGLVANKPDCDSEWFLKSLKEHGEHFRHFLTIDRDGREGTFFYRLRIMDTTTVFPFLLGLYKDVDENGSSRDEMISTLVDLESYLVRRMICRLTTKNYNRLFLELLSDIKTAGESFTNKAVRAFLLRQTADSGRWPSDEEFYKAWLDVPIYHAITRPRLRMILRALDEGLHTSKTESYRLKETLTVEHFMPQLWKDHWPLQEVDREEPFEERNQRVEKRNHLVQTIGNLTLLTQSLNPYLSNGPLAKKKADILRHSATNINRFLTDIDSWDETAILNRSKELFDFAVGIWPHPVKQKRDTRAGEEVASLKVEEAEVLVENRFFQHAVQQLGEGTAGILRSFYHMVKHSPFDILWEEKEMSSSLAISYSQLCPKSLVGVYPNGEIEIRFGNIRGTEDAEVFKEVLKEELEVKLPLCFPAEWHEEYLRFPADDWLAKSDVITDILDNLIAQLFEIEQ